MHIPFPRLSYDQGQLTGNTVGRRGQDRACPLPQEASRALNLAPCQAHTPNHIQSHLAHRQHAFLLRDFISIPTTRSFKRILLLQAHICMQLTHFFFLIKNSKPFQVPGNKFLFLEKKIEQKNQASGMLWDSYAMLYFLNKNQDKGFDEYFSASFRCERQPRKSNVVTSGSALRLIGGLPW